MSIRILVVDSQRPTAQLLSRMLDERGHSSHRCEANVEVVAKALGQERFDAVVFDYHHASPGELEICAACGESDPFLPMIALSAPGEARRNLERWLAAHGLTATVVHKPISGETLFRALDSAVAQRRATVRADSYAGLVGEQGRRWLEAAIPGPALVEQAILFTDIRRSTQLVSSMPLPEWFDAVNRGLSAHARVVREGGGSVIKYTGDGLMAAFNGRGRSHLALRCALRLQALEGEGESAGMLAGFGLAEGLVMTGLIGEPDRRQYDVIGATVHLAARLCSIAREGEIVATPRMVRSAGMTAGARPLPSPLNLRGFPLPIDCVSVGQPPDPSHHRGIAHED